MFDNFKGAATNSLRRRVTPRIQNVLKKMKKILNQIKRLDSFPNTHNAYRIMLTVHVTIASTEKVFSKLKLIKSSLIKLIIK
uniref:HAT C-terminal dimerisation domain-containing protein n=1 Tax=Solanum tuberosum TaxID=4113 RepID=M1DHS8_SOLTU